jgi:serine/threonine protein kinase
MVKLKYLIDGHWCEKVLLRNSDMLRPRQKDEPDVGRNVTEPAAREAEPFSPPPRQPGPATSSRAEAAPAQRASATYAGTSAAGSSATYSGKSPRTSGSPAATKSPEPVKAPSQPAPATSAEEWPSKKTVEEIPSKKTVDTKEDRTPGLLEGKELQFGQVLGSGGFGAVYKGVYRGEEVAIKKLHPMDGMITPQQMEEFKKEVANLQALRHERLVRFIGAAYVKPSLCLVLEFMANGSLYDLLHQRKTLIHQSQRMHMAVQIAEGVEFLHGRTPPFVHRDLKSLNVVLDMALNCKLCDFGLTQSMEKTHISRKDNEGGSPRYMAPELFDSKGRITEKVDVWALGCLAVEVFTGRVPHEECNTIQQVMIKTLVNKHLPYLDWAGSSRELRSLAETCFEFDTRVRTDAARFLAGLRGLQGRI